MADKKISALTGASTPLAGTEVLPIVQSGATVKVSVANLTAGRNLTSGKIDVTYADATYAAGLTVTNTTNNIASQAKVYAVNNAGDYFSLGRNSAALGSQSVLFSTGAFPIDFYTNTNYVASFTSAGNLSLATGNLVIATSGKGIDFSATSHPAGMTSELLADYEEGTFTPTDGSGAGLTFSNVTAKYTKVGNQVTVQVKLKYPVTASAVGAAIGGLPFTPSTDCSGVYYSGVSAGSTYYAGGVMYLANSAGGAVTNATVSNQFVIYNMTYTV